MENCSLSSADSMLQCSLLGHWAQMSQELSYILSILSVWAVVLIVITTELPGEGKGIVSFAYVGVSQGWSPPPHIKVNSYEVH